MKGLPQTLQSFFQGQKARYGELFWYEIQEQENEKAELILMTEKLAEKVRQILIEEKIENINAVSFETGDSVGCFYSVEAGQIDVEQRPDRQEYYSIMDKDLESSFTDLTNDVFKDQLVRIFQPRGYKAFCVVVYHSFGPNVPRGPIGWIKSLQGLKKLTGQEFQKPQKLKTLEESVKGLEGVKYRMGGGSFENGFDCSALVQRIFYETKGVWLPRKARWQWLVCEPVESGDLQRGDLVFFNKIGKDNDGIDHVALVWEARVGKMPVVFHSKRLNKQAKIEDLNAASWLNQPASLIGWEINGFGRVKSA